MQLEHNIKINASLDRCFKAIEYVAGWPEIFEPCLSGEVISSNGKEQKIALSARSHGDEGEILSWTSNRDISKDSNSIIFRQEKKSHLLEDMSGVWKFEAIDEETTLVTLQHTFMVKKGSYKNQEGFSSDQDVEKFFKSSINTNSESELWSLKTFLEVSSEDLLSFEFIDKMAINRSCEEVFPLLADPTLWPTYQQHCLGTEVLYDDLRYQEFIMKVQVADKIEKIRSIRIVEDNKISYFQPNPPSVLEQHQGRWNFEKAAQDRTIITSWHKVVINEEKAMEIFPDKTVHEVKLMVWKNISTNSRSTMLGLSKFKENYHAT